MNWYFSEEEFKITFKNTARCSTLLMTQKVHLKILASDLATFRTVLHARKAARKLWLASSVGWKMNCFQN